MSPEHKEEILAALQQIETDAEAEAFACRPMISKVHPSNQVSAANLIHYLSLRKVDLRPMQENLHNLGLSSLSNSESHTLHQIHSVIQWLQNAPINETHQSVSPEAALSIRHRQSQNLFGKVDTGHMPYIMVTLDARMVDNTTLMSQFLEEGMNIARINCAHDDEVTWENLVNTLRSASQQTGKPCRIYMDLAGPKLRTGLPGKGQHKKGMHVVEGQKLKLVEPEYPAKENERVVSCSVRGIIQQLVPGQKVLFDDGLISTTVQKVTGNKASLSIERVSDKKNLLKSGKGINFPNAQLKIVSLTKEDKAALPYVAKTADLVGYSFVRYPEDLKALQQRLDDLSTNPPPVIIKIETPEAFAHLPELLLQGMKQKSVGVMIARGDLAVEVGFERMSELQEEILWICEAAHVPVIWATQVLENLNKTGMATRSEATDAARSFMAECVMINKGHHTVEVIRFLRNTFSRSEGHRSKHRHLFRPLSVALEFFQTRKRPKELSC